MDKNLIIVNAGILPDVFTKVLSVKKLMSTGEAKSVSEAAKIVGLSRSAFYKYKDHVFPFSDMQGIVTLFFELADVPGILSDILKVLANAHCNILTINQNIPINGMANLTVSFRTDESECDTNELIKRLKESNSKIKTIELLAKQ